MSSEVKTIRVRLLRGVELGGVAMQLANFIGVETVPDPWGGIAMYRLDGSIQARYGLVMPGPRYWIFEVWPPGVPGRARVYSVQAQFFSDFLSGELDAKSRAIIKREFQEMVERMLTPGLSDIKEAVKEK